MFRWITRHCKKCLQRSVLISDVPTVMDLIVASCSVLLRGRPQEPELCTLSMLEIVVVIMVLIDRASNDDSNGGQFIIWSNLDLALKIRLSAGFASCRGLS